MSKLCALSVLTIHNMVAMAMDVEELFVSHKSGDYHIRFVSSLNAPAEYVRDLIVDYKYAYRINPAITEVEVLPSDNERAMRVRNSSDHSVGPFHFKIDWTGDIEVSEHGYIRVDTVPEEGDFESGLAFWVFYPQDEGSWVLYDAVLNPSFFIPPIIGDHILMQRLRNEIISTFSRIECYAKRRLELEMEDVPQIKHDDLMTNAKCDDLIHGDDSLFLADQ
jgi:hypothetical protein